MAEREQNPEEIKTCINDALTDDELRAILAKLPNDRDRDSFGLVCKRWLHLQSTERKKICVRAGPFMLRKMAVRFSGLIELDLSQSTNRSFYPGVTDSDLSVIASGFGCLRVLKLKNCKAITDTGMLALGNGLSCLQSLDVSCCTKLRDKGLSAVSQSCPNLRSLHLAGCRFVTDGLLQALSKNCPNLEELGMQGCINITDSGLTVLVDRCRRIKHLDINKCSDVGDLGVLSVSKACSASLRTLKLLYCYKVSDESIFSLSQYCKNLETLIIGGCHDISDESIKSLATACNHSLKNLQMDGCLNITDSCLSCILSVCVNLETLDVGCREEATDAAFQGLRDGNFESGLKVLKVNNCPKITVTGIGMILKSCKFLEFIDVSSCPRVTKSVCDEAGLKFPKHCIVRFTGSLNDPDFFLGHQYSNLL